MDLDPSDTYTMESDEEEAVAPNYHVLSPELLQLGRESVKRAVDVTQRGSDLLYDLQLREIELEISLVKDKSHPDYNQRMEVINERRNRDLKRARAQLGSQREIVKRFHDSQVKTAKETMMVRELLKRGK